MTTFARTGVLQLPYLMPEQYDAGGKGETNDSAALEACITQALALGITRIVCAGRYRLDSIVDIPMAAGDYLHFEGGGQFGKTFQSNNADGCLKFGDSTAKQWNVTFDQCGWEPLIRDAGTPLQVLRGEEGYDVDSTLVMTSCFVGALNDNDRDVCFSEGIVASNNYRPMFWNVRIGSRDLSGTKWNAVFNVNGSFKPEWFGCFGNVTDGAGATYGCSVIGDTQEGFNFVETTINGADYGIYILKEDGGVPNRQPAMRMHQGHLNSRIENIRVDGLKYALIDGPLLYSSTAPGDFIDLHITNAQGVVFRNIMFRNPADGTKRHVWLEARSGGIVEDITLEIPGLFADIGSTPPVYIDETVGKVTIRLPVVVGTTDNIDYPQQLVELHPNKSWDDITITTDLGPVSYDDDNGEYGPWGENKRLSPTPVNNHNLGGEKFIGNNAALDEVEFASVRASSVDVTATSEEGSLEFWIRNQGDMLNAVEVKRGAALDETTLIVQQRASGNTYVQKRVKRVEATVDIGGVDTLVDLLVVESL